MPETRNGAIDVAKGVAILGVILIHSQVLVPSAFQTHVISRAVPVFMVLFGLTSTLWWEKTPAPGRIAAYYRSRFVRLLPAYWLAVALWWGGQRVLSSDPLGLGALVASIFGYAPWMQTSWFVTAILQLIVVFPLLRLAVDALGAVVVSAAALAVLVFLQANSLVVNAWVANLLPHPVLALGFYPFWIFIPHYLWLVACGMQMTSLARSPRAATLLVAFGVFLVPLLVEPLVTQPSALFRIAESVADPARTVLLLAVASLLVRVELLSSALAWLGRNSWEVYVGHMAVHSLVYPAWERAGGPLEHRIEYTLVLLAGGVGFALALGALRASGKK